MPSAFPLHVFGAKRIAEDTIARIIFHLMSRETSIFRGLLIFGICIPLALFLGYQLANPLQRSSIFWIVLVLSLMLVPILLRWHHTLLIVTWNIALVAFLLPGRPQVGFLVGGVSLLFSVVRSAVVRERPFISCPSVSIPLIILAAITLFTAYRTGGIHANAFGSDTWGAMRYFGIVAAIVGYFAFAAQPIPPRHIKLLVGLYFLSGVTAIAPVLIELLGSRLSSLLMLFPQFGVSGTNPGAGSEQFIERFIGVTFFSEAVCFYMLVRFGIRNIFDWHRPWRLAAFVGVFAIGLLGGFRSFVIMVFLLFLAQFYFEGLFRSRLFLVFAGTGVLGFMFLVGFAEHLPLAVQRSVSFLPIRISPVARQDAISTLDWRLAMWREALPLIPKYFFLGKGYNFDSTDYYLTLTAARQRGWATAHDAAMISGGYHNGILTVIIPLGIFGTLAFLVFCWSAIRVLYANYRHGDPELRQINTFLLAYFVARLFFYVIFYGEIYLDLMVFTGAVGLSLSVNRGVRTRASTTVCAPTKQTSGELQLHPALLSSAHLETNG